MFSFLVCLEFAMLDVAKVNYTFSHYRMEGASLSVLVTQLQLTPCSCHIEQIEVWR